MGDMKPLAFDHLIDMALREDLGETGDVTAEAIFSRENEELSLISKGTGILAGSELFRRVFEKVDPAVEVEFLLQDGDPLEKGDRVASVRGRAVSLLTAERTAINFLAFLSGIATAANRYVRSLGREGKTRILDTRKTLPGYRELSKYAVRIGGATNHRMGLYDMVLIKDNHIDLCGSLTEAVRRVRAKWEEKYRVEVECRTLDEVREAVDAGVDVVMLDNMSTREMKQAVRITSGRVETEVSGNVDMGKIKEIRTIGPDYISVGEITHSAGSFDFSLKRAEGART